MNSLGRRLRWAIHEAGLLNKAAAADMGINPIFLSRVINQDANIRDSALIAFCQKHGYSIDWIKTGEGVPKAEAIAELVQGMGLVKEASNAYHGIIQRALTHSPGFQDTLAKFVQIMTSDNTSVKEALTSNVDTFYEAVHWKTNLNHAKEEIENLKSALNPVGPDTGAKEM